MLSDWFDSLQWWVTGKPEDESREWKKLTRDKTFELGQHLYAFIFMEQKDYI